LLDERPGSVGASTACGRADIHGQAEIFAPRRRRRRQLTTERRSSAPAWVSRWQGHVAHRRQSSNATTAPTRFAAAPGQERQKTKCAGLSANSPVKPGRGRSFRRALGGRTEVRDTGAQSKHRPRPGSAGVRTGQISAIWLRT
jgi:hypothetical protein